MTLNEMERTKEKVQINGIPLACHLILNGWETPQFFGNLYDSELHVNIGIFDASERNKEIVKFRYEINHYANQAYFQTMYFFDFDFDGNFISGSIRSQEFGDHELKSGGKLAKEVEKFLKSNIGTVWIEELRSRRAIAERAAKEYVALTKLQRDAETREKRLTSVKEDIKEKEKILESLERSIGYGGKN